MLGCQGGETVALDEAKRIDARQDHVGSARGDAHEPVSLHFLAPPSTGNVTPSFEPSGA